MQYLNVLDHFKMSNYGNSELKLTVRSLRPGPYFDTIFTNGPFSVLLSFLKVTSDTNHLIPFLYSSPLISNYKRKKLYTTSHKVTRCLCFCIPLETRNISIQLNFWGVKLTLFVILFMFLCLYYSFRHFENKLELKLFRLDGQKASSYCLSTITLKIQREIITGSLRT